MTTLDKIKAEIEQFVGVSIHDVEVISKNDVLQIIDKYAEQEPCDDVVSRQAVMDLISKFILEIHSEGGRDLNAHTNDVLRQILRNVKSDRVLPSVRPQEQTGHWIGIDEEPHEDYECDHCGYVVSTFTANIEPHTEYKYCPNCGARMESEE